MKRELVVERVVERAQERRGEKELKTLLQSSLCKNIFVQKHSDIIQKQFFLHMRCLCFYV
jgi:hypothetical protein